MQKNQKIQFHAEVCGWWVPNNMSTVQNCSDIYGIKLGVCQKGRVLKASQLYNINPIISKIYYIFLLISREQDFVISVERDKLTPFTEWQNIHIPVVEIMYVFTTISSSNRIIRVLYSKSFSNVTLCSACIYIYKDYYKLKYLVS